MAQNMKDKTSRRKPKRAPGELTPKQRRFVDEYLVDCNATSAAIRAGYSAKTAHAIGPELLGKTWASIEAAMAKRSQAVRIDAEEVLRRFATLAGADVRDFLDYDNPDGSVHGVQVKPLRELTAEQRMCISEVSDVVDKAGRKVGVHVKLHDKVDALKMLAKHLGLVVTRVAGADGKGPVQVETNARVVYAYPDNGRDPQLGEPAPDKEPPK